MVQDVRVEAHALNSSCENIKTTTVEQKDAGTHQKKIARAQRQRTRHSKMVEGAQSR